MSEGSGVRRDTLVVLPTYNEVGSLADVVGRVHAAAPEADVLIVDDASPDGTGDLADRLAAADPRVRVLHRAQKLGLGSAYVAGFTHGLDAGYRWCVEMDGDGSHLPEQLPALLAAAAAGAGLVVGTRWMPSGRVLGWPAHRRWISRTGTRVARVSLRSRLRDITSGYRVLDARWLRLLDLDRIASHGYGFQVELAWTLERFGCPITEVPIDFVERRSGRSKMSLAIVFEALRRVLSWGWLMRFAPARLPRPVVGAQPHPDLTRGLRPRRAR